MLWFLGTVAVVYLMLVVCELLGAVIAQVAPTRLRLRTAVSFAPVLGLAVLVLLATVLGWVGHGFDHWSSVTLSIVLFSIVAILRYRLGKGFPRWGFLAVLVVPVCLAMWLPLIRFEAFDVYNDAFTYLAQAQWLQKHPFNEPVQLSPYHPALSQIALFQGIKGPMGASFLLGYLQGLFAIRWSYLVYPAASTLPVVCLCAVLASLPAAPRRGVRCLRFLAAVIVGVTPNGFLFGATHGFLPQTYGLCFALAALLLLAVQLEHARSAATWWLRAALAPALCLAATVYTYHPLVPFVVAAAFLFVLATLFTSRQRVSIVLALPFGVAVATLLLAAPEIRRYVNTLPIWPKVVVGAPVDWHVLYFPAHAAGLLTGPWDGSKWILGSASLSWATLALVLVVGFMGVFTRPPLLRGIARASWAFLTVTIIAFCYFRYRVPSPWPTGVGQSWSQFKLANWASPFALTALATGVLGLRPRLRGYQRIATTALAVYCLAGFRCSVAAAESASRAVRSDAGVRADPFATYRTLSETLLLPKERPLYIDLEVSRNRNRQLLTYFLADRPLASIWSTDPYFASTISAPGYQTEGPGDDMWVLTVCAGAIPRARQVRIGSFCLFPPGEFVVSVRSVQGGYGQESDGLDTWRWTAKTLSYLCVNRRPAPVKLKAIFTCLPASVPRRLNVTLKQGSTSLRLASKDLLAGWQSIATPVFEIKPGEFILTFETDAPPVRLGTDPRPLAYLIRNLSFERAASEIHDGTSVTH